jgi:hypothetical protein
MITDHGRSNCLWRELPCHVDYDGNRYVRRSNPNPNISGIHFCILKNRAVKYFKCFDDRILTSPVHTHNIDPVRIVSKKRRKSFHIVTVPRLKESQCDSPDFLLIRGTHEKGICNSKNSPENGTISLYAPSEPLMRVKPDLRRLAQ